MKAALIVESLILFAILLRWIIIWANKAIDDYNANLKRKQGAIERWNNHEATRKERFDDMSRQIGGEL